MTGAIQRSAPAPVPRGAIQRMVVDEETGHVLPRLTLADLLTDLSPRVVRALNLLPVAMRRALGDLPLRAQMTLIDLPEATQLQIIAELSLLGRALPPHAAALGDAANPGQAVVVGRGGAAPRPGQGGGLPADLRDFLLGRGGAPEWLRGVRIPMPRRAAAAPRLLLGPPALPAPRLAPLGLGRLGPIGFGRVRLPGLRALGPPPIPLPRHLPTTPQEQLFGAIEARGRPAHRSRADVASLVNQLPGLDADEALSLLRLPARRSLANLRQLVAARPLHRSLPFMVGLAAANPTLSVENLRRLADLPHARTADIPLLVANRPVAVGVRELARMAVALPARSAQDILALAALFPARSIPDIILIGGAAAHRSGPHLVRLARRLPACTPAELVALANIPVRSLGQLEELGRGISPVRTAVILVTLATTLGAIDPEWLVLLADLPGCTLLPAPQARAICNALSRHRALLGTAANAQAALATAHIGHNSIRLRDVIAARDPLTHANLMVVLNWAHYAGYANMLAIVGHAKIDTMARLVAWLNNAAVDDGNRLLAVLQNPKIENAADIDYLLIHMLNPRYSLTQLAQWLGRPWATRGAGVVKTFVNGRVPLNQVPGAGGTAGQRYTPDQNSGAWGGHVYHLSMSFTVGGPHNTIATFTGFHVTWRAAGAIPHGADPRQFFTVNGGLVAVGAAAGAYPGGPGAAITAAAMLAEATALMESYLPRLNCWM